MRGLDIGPCSRLTPEGKTKNVFTRIYCGRIYQLYRFPGYEHIGFDLMTTMKLKKSDSNTRNRTDREPRRIRLPGFIADEDIGLGDVIKRATSAVGIRPCGGCQQRAAALNRRFVFTGWRSK
jgi:hypothetical protein